MGNRRTTDVKDAAEVRLDDLGPLSGAHLGDLGKPSDTGVVDHDIEAAEAFDGHGHGPIRVGGVPDVGDDRVHLARRHRQKRGSRLRETGIVIVAVSHPSRSLDHWLGRLKRS